MPIDNISDTLKGYVDKRLAHSLGRKKTTLHEVLLLIIDFELEIIRLYCNITEMIKRVMLPTKCLCSLSTHIGKCDADLCSFCTGHVSEIIQKP
jgi:hypothetical protein